MRFLGYPIYKILVALLLGLLLHRYVQIPLSWSLVVMFSALAIIALCLLMRLPYALQKGLFFAGVVLFFISFAVVNASLRAPQYHPSHYTHVLTGSNAFIELSLEQELPPNGFSKRFYARVKQVDDKITTGKVLFQWPLTDSLLLRPGHCLKLATTIQPIATEKNPSDFKYHEYLAGIDVYGRVYGKRDLLLTITDETQELGGFLAFKNTLRQRLETSSLREQPRAFLEALLLGNREHINPEVTASFRDAGVIHILALSGLHVGILLLILSFLTSWLHRFKYGKMLQSALLVVLLWMFGVLTGLSPSIMRAITMFSFVAVAMNMNRSTSVLHSLALSAFFLLVINPKLLFQVGFQLSYIAVIAIVTIQPILAAMWRPKQWALKYVWGVVTVTVAAQIGVGPISIFYFHQFPLLFIVGNVMLLPLMPLILGACLLFICLVLVDLPSAWLATPLNAVFEFFIKVITQISEARSFIITDLYLTLTELLLVYGILLSTILFFYKVVRKSRLERAQIVRPNNGLHVAIALTTVLLLTKSVNDHKKTSQLVVMHQNLGTAVAVIENKQALLLTDMHLMDSIAVSSSKARLISSSLFQGKRVQNDSLKNLITWNKQTLLTIGPSGFYDRRFKHAVVLLSHEPKLNLERMINELRPKKIIADGSNFKQSVAQWQETCAAHKVPFASTYAVGAIKLGD